MRFRLRTLLIVMAVAAALAVVGVLEFQEGIFDAYRSLKGVAPESEQRQQEIRDLAHP